MDLANERFATLNRQELYERVWNTPASKLAKEFGISDVGLGKVCKRHKIPRPPRGYWAQLAVGKQVRRPALPKLDESDLEEVRIFRLQFFAQSPESDAPTTKDSVAIEVAESLGSPHPLVDQTRRQLRQAKAGDDKILRPDGNSTLNIRVTKSSLDRALRIFDALIKNWESLGGTVDVGSPDRNQQRSTEFRMHGDNVRVEMFEEIDRIATKQEVCRNWKYRDCKYEPTGCLVLQLDCFYDNRRTRWADGKRQRLETMLTSFTDGLIELLNSRQVKRLDDECEARQRTAVQTIRDDEAKRKELAEQRRTRLLEEIDSWKQASEIRAYLATIREKIDAGDMRVTDAERFDKWFDWAEWYADSIDPLTVPSQRDEFVISPT